MKLKRKANDRGLKSRFRKPVTIVKESKPNVVIVIPERASESGDEHTAAEELKDYLYKVSKAEVQIKHENETTDRMRNNIQYLHGYQTSESCSI
jgi:RNase H-fold protein (predicted Holliday junction resolvase)